MTDQTPAAAASAAPIKTAFVAGKPRAMSFELTWPITVDGAELRHVFVKRLTAGEVETFIDGLRSAPEGAKARFPVFVDATGALIPDEVWRALDADDVDRLNEAANDFLPARFRTGTTTAGSSPSTPATGGSSPAA